jgi:hypothetical protein
MWKSGGGEGSAGAGVSEASDGRVPWGSWAGAERRGGWRAYREGDVEAARVVREDVRFGPPFEDPHGVAGVAQHDRRERAAETPAHEHHLAQGRVAGGAPFAEHLHLWLAELVLRVERERPDVVRAARALACAFKPAREDRTHADAERR